MVLDDTVNKKLKEYKQNNWGVDVELFSGWCKLSKAATVERHREACEKRKKAIRDRWPTQKVIFDRIEYL